MLRLFVGIPVPDDIRAALEGLCHGLHGVRWVKPENFHLTLRFVGEVDEMVAEDLDATLSGIHAPRFEMALSEIGFFENGRAVRAIWAGAEKTPPLIHLHDKVESATVRAGLPPEARKFRPHVTLARPRGLSHERLAPYLETRAGFRAPPFEVDRFVLFRSHLKREGAHYEILADYGLP